MIKKIYVVEFEQVEEDGFTLNDRFYFETLEKAGQFMDKNTIYSNVRRLQVALLDIDNDETSDDLKYLYDKYLIQFDTLGIEYYMIDSSYNIVDFETLITDAYFEYQKELLRLFGENYDVCDFENDIPFSKKLEEIEIELQKYNTSFIIDELCGMYKDAVYKLVINKKSAN